MSIPLLSVKSMMLQYYYFIRAILNLLKLPKIAVVGSRSCSQTGTKSVRKVIEELENELVIVSGLARGIDTAAHMSILQGGGKNYCSHWDWLGCLLSTF